MSTLVFADNFNRANGPLGTDWVVLSGAMAIDTNKAKITSTGWALANYAASGEHQMVSIQIATISGTSLYYVRLRSTLAGNDYYYSGGQNASGTTVVFNIVKVVSGTPTTLVSNTRLGQIANGDILRFAAVGSDLVLWLNDNIVLWVRDPTITAGGYAGFYGANTTIRYDDFSFNELGASAFLISPTIIADPGAQQDIDLVSAFGNWVAGTPGTPLFTARVGEIVAQTVHDATSATIAYVPPTLIASDLITDPLNGTFAPLDIMTDFQLGGGGGGGEDSMEPYVAAMGIAGINPALFVELLLMLQPLLMPGTGGSDINRLLAILGDDTQQPSFQDNWLQLVTNMSWLSQWVTNGNEPSETLRAVAEGSRTAATGAYGGTLSIQGDPAYTLRTVIEHLAGIGGLTHYDLNVAIGAIAAPDLDPILDELAAIRTNQLYTLGSIMANLAAMRTVSNWTLGEVIDAVNAVRGNGSPTIDDVLSAIANLPSPVVDLQPVLEAVAAVASQVSTVNSTVNTINGKADDIHAHVDTLETSAASIYSFLGDIHTDLGVARSDILSAISALSGIVVAGVAAIRADIAALKAHLDALLASMRGHPVWPGQDNVDLGAEIPVLGSTFIAQPMHGLLITRLTKQQYDGTWGGGGRHYARHWAKAAFETAEGQTEPFQYLGWESSLLVPLQMQVAAGVTLYLEPGCTGAVRPWTYKA